jgi:WD40-like Beta Propeller Repeat
VARFVSALVLFPVIALAAAGCGGGKSATSGGPRLASLSISCSPSRAASSSTNLLWLGGAQTRVYYVHGGKVISSAGRSRALPSFARAAGFRACAEPVLLYTMGSELRATALSGSRKTLTLGQNAVVAPNGQLVSYAGTRVTYAGGSSFAARGLPLKWRIASLVVSPRDSHLLLAAAQSPEAGIETCGKGLGGIYRVTPSGSKTLLVDNPCHDHPQAAFSPSGSTISFVSGSGKDLYVLAASGANPRRLTSQAGIRGYLWSPDGTRIAYVTKQGECAVVAVASGKTHELGKGQPLAWSPDGREVALAAAGKPTVQAVSATGGSSRVLLRVKS